MVGTSNKSVPDMAIEFKWDKLSNLGQKMEPMEKIKSHTAGVTSETSQESRFFWLVVWNMFYFSIYWEQLSHLTNIFQRGWNHQVVLSSNLLKIRWNRNEKSEQSSMKETQSWWNLRTSSKLRQHTFAWWVSSMSYFHPNKWDDYTSTDDVVVILGVSPWCSIPPP